MQLAVLRFPGRPLKDLAGIPALVLAAIADQVQMPASAFVRYGERDNIVKGLLPDGRSSAIQAEQGDDSSCMTPLLPPE